ncbi:hypothetical protein B0F90DRAFT_1628611 [Multifurca ochricompacta]|uniref:DUF6535 domain-containing protein n=1 Tax=Multifurca ochricompacta TaxID=376703 RepID=A0AAD4M429_9AGAM|nr:hypothetical protein B0F90DRAFT_1628611 [Multifurca ochricompacta]
MYLNLVKEEDEKMANSWKADADGILIFTGLFSAAVAALVAVSIQDLRPSSQDTSAFYLQNIYQLLASGNISQPSNIPSSLAIPPAFSPPKYAIWVNSLWFLSLVISITCGLLATLLQQWARRYVKGTQPRYSPHKRARIRAFFAKGVDSLHLPWAVEALPTMLHLSLFLFFAGLIIFLFNVNHTVFTVVSCWVGFCTGIYGCIALMPLFRIDSPYYAPLSSTTWYLFTGISFLLFRILLWPAHYCIGHDTVERFRKLKEHYRRLFLNGMGKTAEETALKLGSEFDGRALMWTFESLDEDHELEQFFAGIPGFFRSTVVKKPEDAFTTTEVKKMSDTLVGLMRRTWSSSLIHESVKRRRIVISGR